MFNRSAALLARSASIFAVSTGTHEVGENAVRSGNGFGHLAVEGVGHVDVGALAVAGVKQAAFLRVLSGVLRLREGSVVRVPRLHEGVAALFDPSVEVGFCDFVGKGHERVVGFEDRDLGFLVDNFFRRAAKGVGVGAEIVVVLVGVILDDNRTPVLYIV